jgi:hypothetical protein
MFAWEVIHNLEKKSKLIRKNANKENVYVYVCVCVYYRESKFVADSPILIKTSSF